MEAAVGRELALTLTPPVPAGAGDPGAAATSLPPLVQGPPRCFLRCTVPRVRWAAPQPPAVVRLRWWGETAGGTVLQPAGTALHPAGTAGTALHPAGRTWARFAVRCGPRQLAAYLAGTDGTAVPRDGPGGRNGAGGCPRVGASRGISALVWVGGAARRGYPSSGKAFPFVLS